MQFDRKTAVFLSDKRMRGDSKRGRIPSLCGSRLYKIEKTCYINLHIILIFTLGLI